MPGAVVPMRKRGRVQTPWMRARTTVGASRRNGSGSLTVLRSAAQRSRPPTASGMRSARTSGTRGVAAGAGDGASTPQANRNRTVKRVRTMGVLRRAVQGDGNTTAPSGPG